MQNVIYSRDQETKTQLKILQESLMFETAMHWAMVIIVILTGGLIVLQTLVKLPKRLFGPIPNHKAWGVLIGVGFILLGILLALYTGIWGIDISPFLERYPNTTMVVLYK